MKTKLKSQNGVTLVALTVYILIFIVVIGILTTISNFFYGGVGAAMNTPDYVAEFNKFVMFFAVDIKHYSSATVTNSNIQFEDGPTYRYQNGKIYRNDVEIATDFLQCTFTASTFTVDSITKNIINVNFQIGNDIEDSISDNIDFTLRYW